MRRREFIKLLGGAAAIWPLPALAQQSSGKVWRVAWLSPLLADTLVDKEITAFSDSDWPSALNRPTLSGSILTWVGPSGGGANNGSPIKQTRTLTNQAGGTITSSVQGINFTSGCTISGSNIAVKQCVIFDDAQNILQVADNASNIVIEDCLIYGPGLSGKNNSGGAGIMIASSSGVGNVTIRRCHVHDACHLTHIGGGGPNGGAALIYSDNWMYNCVDSTPSGSHYDVVYFGGGNSGTILFEHNAMYENLYNQTSVILMESYFGPLRNVTINNNIMSGGGGTLYCNDAHNGYGAPTNIVLTNNRMGNYRQGFLASINAGGVTHSGNVDINTGVSVDSQL